MLRPGGRLTLVDFRHTGDHGRAVVDAGPTRVHRRPLGWRLWYGGPWAGAAAVTGCR